MKYLWMKFRDIGPWHFAIDLRELDEETRKAIEGRKHKAFRCRCGVEFSLRPIQTVDQRPNGQDGEIPCPRCDKSLYWENVRAERKAKQQPVISMELIDASK